MAGIYRRVKLALITGWTMDEIDRLGALDEVAIWQVHEAEQALMKPKKKKGAGNKWR